LNEIQMQFIIDWHTLILRVVHIRRLCNFLQVVLDRLCITDEQLLRFERCGEHDHLALTVYQMREPWVSVAVGSISWRSQYNCAFPKYS